MGKLDRRVPRLLEFLLAAPGDPNAWLTFLEALRDEISPDALTVFGAQAQPSQPGLVTAPGIGVRRLQMGELLRPAVGHPSAARLPLGSVFQFPAQRWFERSALFQELLGPAGALPGPGLLHVTERSPELVTACTLVIPRTQSWKPKPRDRELLEQLSPHLVIARRLEVRLAERKRDAAALLSAFDHLLLGVIFLDEHERVSYANQSAAELLGVEAGFTDAAALAAVEFVDPRTRSWRRLAEAGSVKDRGAVRLAHPEDGRPLQLISTPFTWSDDTAPLAARFARAIFIADAKRRSGDPVGVLKEIYGLTPSETRLALLLLTDCSLEEAAKLLGITRSTARGVLKTVFAKTGTNRQASLVRLLMSGPGGQLRVGSDAELPASPTRRAARSAVGRGRGSRR